MKKRSIIPNKATVLKILEKLEYYGAYGEELEKKHRKLFLWCGCIVIGTITVILTWLSICAAIELMDFNKARNIPPSFLRINELSHLKFKKNFIDLK